MFGAYFGDGSVVLFRYENTMLSHLHAIRCYDQSISYPWVLILHPAVLLIFFRLISGLGAVGVCVCVYICTVKSQANERVKQARRWSCLLFWQIYVLISDLEMETKCETWHLIWISQSIHSKIEVIRCTFGILFRSFSTFSVSSFLFL